MVCTRKTTCKISFHSEWHTVQYLSISAISISGLDQQRSVGSRERVFRERTRSEVPSLKATSNPMLGKGSLSQHFWGSLSKCFVGSL